MSNKGWFVDWFDSAEYHLLYGDRDEQEAAYFIKNLVKNISLAPNSLCVDLACGKGRHTRTLGLLGMDALGLDLSPESIAFADSKQWENTRFMVHDMRTKLPVQNAAAVFNLFTSFGYFDNEHDDILVLNNIYGALTHNGFFVQDYLNSSTVLKALPVYETKVKKGLSFEIKKYVEDGFIKKEINFERNGEPITVTEQVKIYTAEQLVNLHIQAGFKILAMFGNYDCDDFDMENSSRIILISKKA